MLGLFTGLAAVALLLAAVLSGALASGDRLRATRYQEPKADRVWRVRAAATCAIIGVVSGLIAWAMYARA